MKLAGSLSGLHEPLTKAVESSPYAYNTHFNIILPCTPKSPKQKCCIRFTRQLVTHVWVAPLIRSSNTLTQQLARRIRRGVERLAGACSSDTSVATIGARVGSQHELRREEGVPPTYIRHKILSIIPVF
jgi:hypothetical protein